MKLKKSLLWLISYLTRLVWRAVVVIIIFVATLVSVGREMAPFLREHKAWLEANLTATIGEMVTMHDVNAYWEGLVPELMVNGLAIGSSVQVDKAVMRIDLLGSAKARALVFDTLDINQAVVRAQIDASAADTNFNLRAYLEFLFGSADIRVRDLELTLASNAGDQLSLHTEELTVQNDNDTHWLNATIAVVKKNSTEKKTPVRLSMKFNGDADNILAGKGNAYLELGDGKNIPALQQFLLGVFNNKTDFQLTKTESLTGQVWATWANQRIEWVSDTDIKNLNIAHANTTALPQQKLSGPEAYKIDFSGKLAGHILIKDGLSNNGLEKEYFIYALPDQKFTVNKQLYALPVFGLQYTTNYSDNTLFGTDESNKQISLYVPALNLASVSQYLGLLPSQKWRDALKTLNPKGDLKNLLIAFPLQSGKKDIAEQKHGLLIRANLSQVSLSAWEGTPTLTSVDGYLEATPDAGFVDIDSRQGFSMHYTTIYRKPMDYKTAQGRVYWSIDPSHNIYVGSKDIQLHGDDGDLSGNFWLDIPSSNQSSELYLAASLANSNVKYRNKYLPFTINESLKKWLDASLQNGDISEGGFIYRGSLLKTEAQERTLQLYSKFKNGRLQFDPSWPAVNDIEGLVLVDNEEVHGQIKSARYFDINLSNAVVDLGASSNHQGQFVTLQADGNGPANDALKVLCDTPLRKETGGVFEGWQFSGNTRGHVNLGLRIGSAEEQEFQEVDLNLTGNDLLVGGVNLPLQQLKGNIHYSSAAGLTATQMNARLWGQDQIINITPVMDGDGLPDISVTMAGNLDPQEAARWAHLPFVHFFQGLIPVEGNLNIALDATSNPEQPIGVLSAHSTMQGVVLDLPAPFKKAAEESLPTTIDVDLWKDSQRYHVNYGNFVTAVLEQNNKSPVKGTIAINQPDSVTTVLPNFLHVTANVDQALLSDWLPVIDRYNAFVKDDDAVLKNTQSKQNNQTNSSASSYPVSDFLIKEFSIGSLKLDEMKLQVNYQQEKSDGNYWDVGFQNSLMTGHYRYFDQAKRLPEVDFDTVKFGMADPVKKQERQLTQEEDNKLVDPLADVVPQDLPAMRVHAKQVIVKGVDIGDWRYVLNPNKHGVTLEDVFVAMPGATVNGIEKDKGATINWIRDGKEMKTETNSKVTLSNKDGGKNLFGIEQTIEAEKTEISGPISWKGSPAMISFRRFQGDLSISSEKGRFLNSTASTDSLRVINVFNFTTWARRLQLDFSDLYKKGLSYDKVHTHVILNQGKVVFDKPLMMDSPSSHFELAGTMDSVQNSIDASLIVTLPVKQNATWIAALAAGLPVAAGVWAASKIFGDQIDKLSSVNYSISGTLDDPKVKFERLLPKHLKDNDDKDATDKKN